MERFLDWARVKPDTEGLYYRTTLWGKVLEVRVQAAEDGTLYGHTPGNAPVPVADYDDRLYWFGPIPQPGDAWRNECPRGKGYVVRALDDGTLRTEYVETLRDKGLVLFAENGRIVRVDSLPATLWFGPIPKPPAEADALIQFRV